MEDEVRVCVCGRVCVCVHFCGFLGGMSVSVCGCLNQNISLCAWSVLTLARGRRSVDKKKKKELFGEASKTWKMNLATEFFGLTGSGKELARLEERGLEKGKMEGLKEEIHRGKCVRRELVRWEKAVFINVFINYKDKEASSILSGNFAFLTRQQSRTTKLAKRLRPYRPKHYIN